MLTHPARGQTELVVKLTGRHGESSIVLPLRVGPQLPVPGLPIESLNLILGWGEEKQAWEPTELPCLPPAGAFREPGGCTALLAIPIAAC